MDEMHIKCPHCGNEMDVSMQGKKSSLVVCVCGRCKAPLFSMDGEVFELDREEFQTLRKKLNRVVNALRECVETRQEISSHIEGVLQKAKEREFAAKEAITKEDIDNLRIDLETCQDVSEFIEKMG